MSSNEEEKKSSGENQTPPAKSEPWKEEGQVIISGGVCVESPETREAQARTLCGTLGLIYDDLDDKSQVVAKRLMSPDFTWSPSKRGPKQNRTVTTFEVEFRKFCEKPGMNVWNDNCSNVFFEENDMKDYLVIRRPGTCYMHAVVALVHYLIAKRTGTSNHEMVDICTYMLKDMDRVKLKDHILGEGGGDSLVFLETITLLTKDDLLDSNFPSSVASVRDELAEELLKKLKAWQEPALVYGFRIENGFKTDGNGDGIVAYRHDGMVEASKLTKCPKTGKQMTHAMLLVGGYRNLEDNNIYFLLQNWWEEKYFVQVSAEYLASTQARIALVLPGITVSIKENFTVIDGEYAEGDTPMECCDEFCDGRVQLKFKAGKVSSFR